jgi:hypothetical protein
MDLIRNRAGLPTLTPVRKNRKGGWYGVLGFLLRRSASGSRQFAMVLNCIGCYTAFKPNEPTEAHIQAMTQNLAAEGDFTLEIKIPSWASVPPVRLDPLTKFCEEVPSFLLYEGSPKKKSPRFWGGSQVQSRSYETELAILDHSRNDRLLKAYWSFYGPALEGFCDEAPFPIGPKKPAMGGHLVPLNKDGGWKIRWIASPYRIHQHVLEPLSNRLYRLLESVPWDFTHAQEKAWPILQKVLAEGKTIHSVDLSSATDHFPLQFQLDVLKQLNNHDPGWALILKLFESLSRSSWLYNGKEYHWKKGQPMGLRPSFPAFGLSHGFLLHHLSGGRDCFAVLGDDVVIWDDTVHTAYRDVLDKWNVPISESKTISSKYCCEFAGAAVFSSGIFHCFKWKDIDDENFLALMGLFGRRFLKRLTSRQRRVYHAVKSLQPPLGLNHEVSDLAESIAVTEQLVGVKIPRKQRYLRFFQWLKNHIPFGSKLSTSYLLKTQRTFDEKVSQAMKKIGLQNFQGDPTIFTQFLSERGVLPHAPGLASNKTVPTLLVRYEQWLRSGVVRRILKTYRSNTTTNEEGYESNRSTDSTRSEGCDGSNSIPERPSGCISSAQGEPPGAHPT